MKLMNGKLNFLLDLGYGSAGKGNICEYLGKNNEFDLCIGNNGPNAGHVHMLDGKNDVAKMIPVSGVHSQSSNILMGSGSVINVDILLDEIKKYKCSTRLNVSAFAPVINEECIEYEKENLRYLASTFQGVGAAIGFQAMRSPKIKLVRDYPELEKWCHYHMADIIINRIGEHKHTGLCEVAQGYGLSLYSEYYPKVTSRQVSVGQALAYLDIPTSLVGEVIGVTRSYMIRVGNVDGMVGSEGHGSSGPVPFDSKEVSWEEVSQNCGREVLEMTTVTKRVRRVFTFSKYLFEMAVRRNNVSVLFFTFADYLNEAQKLEFIDYFKKFDFKAVYFVYGPSNFKNNIIQVI